jgi:hypothetical protein
VRQDPSAVFFEIAAVCVSTRLDSCHLCNIFVRSCVRRFERCPRRKWIESVLHAKAEADTRWPSCNHICERAFFQQHVSGSNMRALLKQHDWVRWPLIIRVVSPPDSHGSGAPADSHCPRVSISSLRSVWACMCVGVTRGIFGLSKRSTLSLQLYSNHLPLIVPVANIGLGTRPTCAQCGASSTFGPRRAGMPSTVSVDSSTAGRVSLHRRMDVFLPRTSPTADFLSIAFFLVA